MGCVHAREEVQELLMKNEFIPKKAQEMNKRHHSLNKEIVFENSVQNILKFGLNQILTLVSKKITCFEFKDSKGRYEKVFEFQFSEEFSSEDLKSLKVKRISNSIVSLNTNNSEEDELNCTYIFDVLTKEYIIKNSNASSCFNMTEGKAFLVYNSKIEIINCNSAKTKEIITGNFRINRVDFMKKILNGVIFFIAVILYENNELSVFQFQEKENELKIVQSFKTKISYDQKMNKNLRIFSLSNEDYVVLVDQKFYIAFNLEKQKFFQEKLFFHKLYDFKPITSKLVSYLQRSDFIEGNYHYSFAIDNPKNGKEVLSKKNQTIIPRIYNISKGSFAYYSNRGNAFGISIFKLKGKVTQFFETETRKLSFSQETSKRIAVGDEPFIKINEYSFLFCDTFRKDNTFKIFLVDFSDKVHKLLYQGNIMNGNSCHVSKVSDILAISQNKTIVLWKVNNFAKILLYLQYFFDKNGIPTDILRYEVLSYLNPNHFLQ